MAFYGKGMTKTPKRDRVKEFVGYMTDVEGTQRLFKDYEGEDRQAQKDDLLKKIQTNGYAYAQSLRLPNLPGNASDVSLKDAQSYLVTKAQND